MEITIGFDNPNTGADGINVYRGTVPLNPNSLPAIYETISGVANSYTDANVVRGTQYYYIFETFKGTTKVRSGNIAAAAQAYTGPGPNTFKYGDMNHGYFGMVPAADFLSWDNYIAWTGLTYSGKSSTTDQYWLKFAHKGKILYVAHQPIASVPWQTLYNAGLVYGVDGPGPRDVNVLPEVNQLSTITISGNLFKARLLTHLPPGMITDPATLTANMTPIVSYSYGAARAKPSSYDTLIDFSGAEWDDLMTPLFPWTPTSQRVPNWDPLDTLLAFNSGTVWQGLLYPQSMGQDIAVLNTTKVTIGRGQNYNNLSYHPNFAGGALNITTAGYYRPVLEWMPD